MRRGAVVAIVAGSAALLVIAGGLTIWLVGRAPSAESVAGEYLRALSEGDFAAIETLTEDGIDDAPAVEAAFAGATSYLSDYSFELSDGPGDATLVAADVQLDGAPASVTFELVSRHGRWWVGADQLAALTVETSIGDSVRVGDAVMPASEPVRVLPAVYPVAAAPAGLLAGTATAVVTGAGPVDVTVDATLAAGATTLAQQQLEAYADACAQPAAAVPGNCGLRVPWAADLASLTSIAFRIDEYPVVALTDDGRTFAATNGVIVATATGMTRDAVTGSFTYRADDWALRGDVTFTADEMVLAVR